MNPWQTIVYWYKNILSKQLKITFFSAVVTGILAHLFTLTNVLNNYDSITQVPKGVGTSLPSGRWFLMYMEKFQNRYWDTYNVPFFNGLVTILLIAVAACLITNMFHIKDTLNCMIVGAVLICFPTITSMMFFMYTAPHYATAIVFSVLSVYLADKTWFTPLISILLIACSLGIYQAFLPLTAGLMVLLLTWRILCKTADWKKTLLTGTKYLLILGSGVIAYMGILKYVLGHYQVELSNYQGVNNMGSISFSQLPVLLKEIYKIFFHLSDQNYHEMNATLIVQKGILVLCIISAVLVIYYLIAYKRTILDRIMAIFLFAVLPAAIGSVEIICPQSDIYTLMIYGMVVIYLIPVILLELSSEKTVQLSASKKITNLKVSRWLHLVTSWALSVCLLLITVNYIWSSNVNYTLMYYADVETQEYLASMMTRMRATEGYTTETPVAFIGNKISDPTYDNVWEDVSIMYGGNDSTFINRYSRIRFFNHILSFQYTEVSGEQLDKIKKKKEVKNMKSYPNDNSIKMVDGVLVVKLKN